MCGRPQRQLTETGKRAEGPGGRRHAGLGQGKKHITSMYCDNQGLRQDLMGARNPGKEHNAVKSLIMNTLGIGTQFLGSMYIFYFMKRPLRCEHALM